MTKMKCLIVTTHPLNNSLCKMLSDHIINQLKNMGHSITTEDLYAEEFNPVLTTAERKSYYKPSYDQSEIAKQVSNLKEAEALILVFPTWWFSFPAMLKGWFDRIWGPSIAYNHASDLGAIKPLLDNLEKVLVVTSLGSPWWVDKLLMRQPVKRIIKTALLGTCAPKSKLTFLSLYNSEKLDPKKISAFKKSIDNTLKHWS